MTRWRNCDVGRRRRKKAGELREAWMATAEPCCRWATFIPSNKRKTPPFFDKERVESTPLYYCPAGSTSIDLLQVNRKQIKCYSTRENNREERENKKPECHGANVGGTFNSQTTVILPPEKIHWVPHPPPKWDLIERYANLTESKSFRIKQLRLLDSSSTPSKSRDSRSPDLHSQECGLDFRVITQQGLSFFFNKKNV